MNASEMTFGVEIECCLPEGVEIMIGAYRRGIQVPQLPAGWKAERDGSIVCPVGFKACEIVSPVLKGADGLRQLLFVLGWLREQGARVNASTGFHVHVGFDATKAAELGRVVTLVARHEKGLYAVTGTRSRERGEYCQPIKDAAAYTRRFKGATPSRHSHDLPIDRYFTLNLANLALGTKPTVEFRVFAGTLSEVKAVGYVRLCLGLVEKAFKTRRAAAWDLAKNADERRKYPNTGEGRFAAIKLVYGLGWKKGEVAEELGAVDGDGLPATAAIVAEFYRLADKYDGGTAD